MHGAYGIHRGILHATGCFDDHIGPCNPARTNTAIDDFRKAICKLEAEPLRPDLYYDSPEMRDALGIPQREDDTDE